MQQLWLPAQPMNLELAHLQGLSLPAVQCMSAGLHAEWSSPAVTACYDAGEPAVKRLQPAT
jgi:hypothetical protein